MPRNTKRGRNTVGGRGPGTRAALLARDRFRELFDGPDTTDARYAIGCLVAEVKADPETYGVGAVARMAELLGKDLNRLYRYASVAECWTEAEAHALLAPPQPGPHPLTWSHLVTLASIDNRAERDRLTSVACVESLSVRELALRATRRKAPAGNDRQVERAVRAVARLLADRESEHILSWERVRHGDLLDRALAIHEKLHALVGRRIAALRKARDALEERSVLPPERGSFESRSSPSSLSTLMTAAFQKKSDEGCRDKSTDKSSVVRVRHDPFAPSSQIVAGQSMRRE